MTKAITTTDGAAVAPQTGTPADLLRIAVESGADVDKLAQLMDLQERYDARRARAAYYEALAEFQASCPAVERRDKGHNTKYAKLERIVDTVKDALKGCGLTYRYEIGNDDGALSVTCIITHTDGHSERTTMQAPADTSGNKNAIQALGSTTTYLQRYTLCGALGIVTGDEDSDGGAPSKPITTSQAKQLKELVERSGIDVKRILKYGNCKSIDELPAELFQEACNGCLKAIKRNGGES